jgi:PAS domain-containing protein
MNPKPTDSASAHLTEDNLPRQIAGGRPADDIIRLAGEATPNAIVRADAQARILLGNAGVEKFFDYGRGGLPS